MVVPNLDKAKNKRRYAMPQIRSYDYDDFFKWLKKEEGITYKKKTVKTDSLKPTQKEFSEDKANNLADNAPANKLATPILVSKDNYILDGHHRWLANHIKSGRINIIQFDSNIDEFLEHAKKFPKAVTKKLSESETGDSYTSFLQFMEEKTEDKKTDTKEGKKDKKKNNQIEISPDEDESSYAE